MRVLRLTLLVLRWLPRRLPRRSRSSRCRHRGVCGLARRSAPRRSKAAMRVRCRSPPTVQLDHAREPAEVGRGASGAGPVQLRARRQYVAFGEQHGMFIVGHTLVWHNQTPAWVFAGGRPAADRATLLARMREHIQTVVGRYKGRIHGWDVVNEAIDDDGTLRRDALARGDRRRLHRAGVRVRPRGRSRARSCTTTTTTNGIRRSATRPSGW